MKEIVSKSAIMIIAICIIVPCSQAGSVVRLFYDDIPGTNVNELVQSKIFPGRPTSAEVLATGQVEGDKLEGINNSGQNYGTWIRGYLQAPETGEYRFYIASHGNSELWMSTNNSPDHKVLIAQETACCAPLFSGERLEQRQSNPIMLERGEKYYFEVLQKSGLGKGFIRVGWQSPDGAHEVIPCLHLAPFPDGAVSGGYVSPTAGGPELTVAPRIIQGPEGPTTGSWGDLATFWINYEASQPAHVQWFRNKQAINSAALSYYLFDTYDHLWWEQNSFTVQITNALGTIMSKEISLFVGNAPSPPEMILAKPSVQMDELEVLFSKRLSEQSATNATNYRIDNGIEVISARLKRDLQTVVLKVSTLSRDKAYKLTANNILDLAFNRIKTNSQIYILNTQGVVRRKIFLDIGGMRLAGLTNIARYPNKPDIDEYLTRLETPVDQRNNYGAQCIGYLAVPNRGRYVFYLCSSGQSVLFLSTNANPANKEAIAIEPEGSELRNWTGFERRPIVDEVTGRRSNISIPIELEGGQMYYLEVLYTVGTGHDYAGVAWTRSHEPPPKKGDPAIPGHYLSAFTTSGPISITSQPQSLTVQEGNSATISAEVDGSPPYYFQWVKDGQPILNANSSHYTFQPILAMDEEKFTLAVSNNFSRDTSLPAVIRVNPDDRAPVLLSAQGHPSLRKTFLTFSEGIALETATNLANYTIRSTTGLIDVEAAHLTANGLAVLLETASQQIGQVYLVNVTNLTDRAVGRNMIAQGNQASFTAPGTILQSANGLVVIEAELFNEELAQGDRLWEFQTDPVGFSGTGTMQALPDEGIYRHHYPEYIANSPSLDYQVVFRRSGTHYIWIRGLGMRADRSVHAGINGDSPVTARWIGGTNGFGADWAWEGKIDDGTRARIEVPKPGLQIINIWMREDGFRFDKLILTPDSDYVPAGLGPAESERVRPTPRLEISRANDTVILNWTGTGFRLQEKPDISIGQWTWITDDPTPPFKVGIGASNKFFRLWE